jgi:hypothetical protein
MQQGAAKREELAATDHKMNRDRVGEYQSPKIDLQFSTQRLRLVATWSMRALDVESVCRGCGMFGHLKLAY